MSYFQAILKGNRMSPFEIRMNQYESEREMASNTYF